MPSRALATTLSLHSAVAEDADDDDDEDDAGPKNACALVWEVTCSVCACATSRSWTHLATCTYLLLLRAQLGSGRLQILKRKCAEPRSSRETTWKSTACPTTGTWLWPTRSKNRHDADRLWPDMHPLRRKHHSWVTRSQTSYSTQCTLQSTAVLQEKRNTRWIV